MLDCPKCGHSIIRLREELIPFDNFKDWDVFVRHNMKNARRERVGLRTEISTKSKIIAKWDGINYGYAIENRFNHLARIAFTGNR